MTSLLDIPYQVVITSDDSQIAFDATVSEKHTGKMTITEHPVEQGANVADHAQREPDALDIQGIVSNTPILLNFDETVQPSIPGGDPYNRAQDAYDEFNRLKDTAALLDVATEIRDYTDMMIESVSVTRDAPKRHILDIALGLREFRKASVESILAPEPIKKTHKGGAGRGADNGRQNTNDPKPEVEAKAESALEAFANAVDRRRGGAQ